MEANEARVALNRYENLDRSEEYTMRILELYSELLAEGRKDLCEPSAASLSPGFSDFVMQKRMQEMQEEEERAGQH